MSIIAYIANIFRGELGRGKRNSSFFNLHSSLSFILSIPLLFGVSGAWAADWTDESGNEYTALKYIKGTATAYQDNGGWIVLDFKPNSTDIVKMRFRLATTSWNQFLWCNRAGSSSNSNKFGAYVDSSGNFQIQCNSSNFAGMTSPGTDDCTIEVNYSTGKFYVNGIEQTAIIGEATPPATKTMLFASNVQGTSSASSRVIDESIAANYVANRGSYYLYDFQLYSSTGELKHNLMPAKNMKSNAVGLYDTVTSNFYAKATNSGDFIAEEWGSDRTGKKWTGAGSNNLISNGDNWEGGVAPVAGDDLDFTIAVPNAPIYADKALIYGTVYLGMGDLPAFTGSLTATAINDLARMQTYNTATDAFTFELAAPSGQEFTWNSEDAANWWNKNVWTYDNAASSWYDYNNAIFSTAGATVTLDANATANSLEFNANATITGSGVLTVPSVTVVQDVTGTISAPTAGPLEKTGAGTLVLGSPRSDATVLSEGTLVMSGEGTTLDWSKLTLGTDPAKPVTLRFEDGAGLASPSSEFNFGNVPNVTSVVCKAGVDWTHSDVNRIGRAAGANTTFVNESGDFKFTSYMNVGAQASSDATAYTELVVMGGTLSVSRNKDGAPYVSIGSYGAGTLTVTNSGVFNVTASMALSIHSGSGTLNVSDGGTATIGTELVCGWSHSDAGAATVNLGTGGTLVTPTIRCANNGTGTINIDGGTLKAGAAETLIQSSDRMTVNVGAKGGTIDNDRNDITIAKNFNGNGTINLTGAGKTTFAAGVGAEGGVSVENGTTLALDGAKQSSFGALTLADGSTLDIATPASDVAAFAATTLNLPAEGTVTLTSGGGAFGEGLYAICEMSEMSGVTVEDVKAKFVPLIPAEIPAENFEWSIREADNTLMLAVGAINPNTWTGGANNGNLSDPKNWLGGAIPESGTVTINTTGTLTVGDTFRPDVIVFPETCGAVTIAGENAITGLTAITNLSSSTCTFEVPVAFADKIDVYQTAYYYTNSSGDSVLVDGGHVRFVGGVTGSGFAEGTTRRLDGAYTIPATANWIANTTDNVWALSGATDAGGSSLAITNSSYEVPGTADTSLLFISDGCAFTTGVVRTQKRLSYRNFGEYVVTQELEVSLTSDIYISQRRDGTYKFEKLTLNDEGTGTGWKFCLANSTQKVGTKHVYIGEGGVNINAAANKTTALMCGFDDQSSSHDITHLHPWHADYEINGKGGSTRDLLIYRTTYLHTDDENGVARTVTLNGIADVRAALTVKGSGRFQVNSDGMTSGGTGSIKVTDSATLAYASGADLGAGAVTVDENATMEVASGVNTFAGGLILNDGATLAFNFTQRAVTPQIAIADGKALTVNGEVKVKIPKNSKWPTAGEKVLTTCGGFNAEGVTVSLADGAPKWAKDIRVNAEGNIVLTVRPKPTMIIVR